MAVSPDDTKKLSDYEMSTIDLWEAKIDALLMSDKRSLTLNFESERIRKEIYRRYEKVGWKIKFQSDQRDGDWHNFTENVVNISGPITR